MKLIYVAGPYQHADEWQVRQNIEEARRVARLLWKAGFAVLCPHSNSAGFGGSDIPDQVWLDGDLRMLKHCDLVVMVAGWENSTGAVAEKIQAEAGGQPVFFWNDETGSHPDVMNFKRACRIAEEG